MLGRPPTPKRFGDGARASCIAFAKPSAERGAAILGTVFKDQGYVEVSCLPSLTRVLGSTRSKKVGGAHGLFGSVVVMAKSSKP